MSYPFSFLFSWPVVLTALFVVPATAAEFTLESAEALALARDAGIARLQAQSEAYADQAIAGSQLADPKLKFELGNFPTDTFHRRQEPMTQVKLGIVQAFPSPGTLDHRGGRLHSLAGAQRAAVAERRLSVLRGVRQTYLELFFQHRAVNILRDNQRLFQQLVEVSEQQYAAGRGTQQDVVQAQLQLSLLEDREAKFLTDLEQAQAEFVLWLGELPADFSAESFPVLPPELSQVEIQALLPDHPLVAVANQQLQASGFAVALAEDRYKPDWTLDLTYGSRRGDEPGGGNRADFLSAMVMMDLPLFPGKRQDRSLSARKAEQSSARYLREEQLRSLGVQLAVGYAALKRLDERLGLYDERVLKQAELNSEAALKAYQSGLQEFNNLMLARVNELQARIDYLRLRVDRAGRQAALLYLQGEAS